jgi:hypothetical protein
VNGRETRTSDYEETAVADIHVVRTNRRIEGRFNEGWGVAGLVCALAAACALGAWWLHSRTYEHPTDLRMEAVGTSGGGEGH